MAVLDRYARKTKSGKMIHCKPRADQVEDERGRRPSEKKLIYDSEAIAQKVALEIWNLTGVRLYSYPCDRSDSGHRHLTKSPPKTYLGKLTGFAPSRGKGK